MTEALLLDAPVKSLQQMLRTISFVSEGYPSLIPDGIYGNSTEEAVRVFQRTNSLPVTGSVDYNTFVAIVEAYDDAIETLTIFPLPVQRFPQELKSEDPIIYLIQGMLGALSQRYSEIKKPLLTGKLDPVTRADIKTIQQRSGLPETGVPDSRTYNQIIRLYKVTFDGLSIPAYG